MGRRLGNSQGDALGRDLPQRLHRVFRDESVLRRPLPPKVRVRSFHGHRIQRMYYHTPAGASFFFSKVDCSTTTRGVYAERYVRLRKALGEMSPTPDLFGGTDTYVFQLLRRYREWKNSAQGGVIV